MTWLEFVALCLAAGAAVDVWFQGSVFAGLRQKIKDWPTREGRKPFFPALLSCSYCLSFWAPAMVMVLWVLPGMLWAPSRRFLMLPVFALAATRVLTLVDGLLPESLRFEAKGTERAVPPEERGKPVVSPEAWLEATRDLDDAEYLKLLEVFDRLSGKDVTEERDKLGRHGVRWK